MSNDAPVSRQETLWQHRYPYVMLTAAALFWGGNVIVGKLASGHISPYMLTWCRWVGVALLLGIFSQRQWRKDLPVLWQHKWIFIALSITGLSVFNLLLYGALTRTSAINVSIEQASVPMFILLGSALLGGQVRPRQWFGATMAIAGVLVVASAGQWKVLLHLNLNAGDLMMIVACALYSLFSIGLRWRPVVHWSSFLFATSLIAALICTPFAWRELHAGVWLGYSNTSWLLIAYAILGPSLAAQLCYVFGVEAIGAARSGLFINLIPIFGALLAIVFLGEHLHGYHVIAIVMVACGIVLAEAGRT